MITNIIALFFCNFSFAQTLNVDLSPLPQELRSRVKVLKQDYVYKGRASVKNVYSKFSKSTNPIKNPIVILTGLEDPMPLWYDFAVKAIEHGYANVYIVELRGQGQSQRLNDVGLLSVNSVDDYISDFLRFIEQLSSQTNECSESPIFLAHSTGSAVIEMSYSQIKSRFPNCLPKKVVHWAPLFRIKAPGLLEFGFVRSLLSVVNSYFGPIMAKRFSTGEFLDNSVTNSLNRFNMAHNYRLKQGLGTKGVSIRWVLSLYEALVVLQTQLAKPAPYPTLIVQAEDERVVRNDYKIHPDNRKIILIKGAKHGLNVEVDKVRDQALAQTFDFFK